MIRVSLNHYSSKFAKAMGKLPLLALSIASHLKILQRLWKNLKSYFPNSQGKGKYVTIVEILI